MKGDRILFHRNPATVEFVAQDVQDPEQKWFLEEHGGGVMISDPTVSGRTFIGAASIDNYEDLEFVSRA
jgi:hypothetical protein